MESKPVSSVPSWSLLQFLPCLCACRDFPSLWTVSHKKKWFLFFPKVAFDPGVCHSKGTLSKTQGISGQLVSCEGKKLFWKMEVSWQWPDFPTYSSKAAKNSQTNPSLWGPAFLARASQACCLLQGQHNLWFWWRKPYKLNKRRLGRPLKISSWCSYKSHIWT